MCEYGFVEQGWQCPICKRIYSPRTTMCAYCGGDGTFAIDQAGMIIGGFRDRETNNNTVRAEPTSINSYSIGTKIAFELSDGEPVEAMAVRGEDDGTLFITVDCLKDEYLMKADGDFSGGYQESDLRKVLNTEIIKRFPERLRAEMVPFENGDLLRIPTEKEMFGKNDYGESEDDCVQQFDCMKDRRNRIAFQGKNGDWCWYWMQNRRSVRSAAGACYVRRAGAAYSTSASTSGGVRPLFKL